MQHKYPDKLLIFLNRGMEDNELIPHGWMQKDHKKHQYEPVDYGPENSSGEVTNINDVGLLLRYNPKLIDRVKERMQHMAEKKEKPTKQPPKEWFYKVLNKVKQKSPKLTEEQARATVGDLWYNEMGAKSKKRVKKEYYGDKKANIVHKVMIKLSKSDLTSDMGKEVLNLLQEALMGEFQQWDLYYAYKSQLKGLSRDPIEEHFAEHAEEEAEHIDILQRYIVGMGETPTNERKEIPSLKDGNMKEIIELQLKFEIEAVEIYKKILAKLKDNSAPLRIEIENILAQETEHMHDLQLLLRE